MDDRNELIRDPVDGRPRYRQPIGMPQPDDGRRAGAII
jgi:hypothetical protein